MLTKEDFRDIYTRYRSSGLSVRDFFRNEGIAEAKFYYWQKKMSKFQPVDSGFVPLVIEKEHSLPSSIEGQDVPAMRKSFYTLAGIVTNSMQRNVREGEVFIFVNRLCSSMKILHMEYGGLVIYHLKLE